MSFMRHFTARARLSERRRYRVLRRVSALPIGAVVVVAALAAMGFLLMRS